MKNTEADGIELNIYDYKKRKEKYLEEAENSINSKHILKFYSQELIQKEDATQIKYLQRLLFLSEKLNKDFVSVKKKDVETLFENLNKNLKQNTIGSYSVVLKRFFRWLKNTPKNVYPEEVSWLNGNTHHHSSIKPEQLLNEDDIEKMLKVAEHPRDKAFLITLFESGCRISEILTLQIKNINFDDRGAFFVVEGKTGSRRVRVVNSTPYLHNWIEIHPEKENKNSPLWINIGSTKNISKNPVIILECKQCKQEVKIEFEGTIGRCPKCKSILYTKKKLFSYNLTYAAASLLIKKAAKKAGITKKFNCHNFRHSRATLLASSGLNAPIMNEVMGWSQGSKMSAVYLHLSGTQTDDALLSAMYGMKIKERKDRQPSMFPLKCISCGELNPYNATRCRKCNNIIGIINKQDIEQNSAMIMFAKIAEKMFSKDGELKKEFVDEMAKQIVRNKRKEMGEIKSKSI